MGDDDVEEWKGKNSFSLLSSEISHLPAGESRLPIQNGLEPVPCVAQRLPFASPLHIGDTLSDSKNFPVAQNG